LAFDEEAHPSSVKAEGDMTGGSWLALKLFQNKKESSPASSLFAFFITGQLITLSFLKFSLPGYKKWLIVGIAIIGRNGIFLNALITTRTLIWGAC
jgi:hypothetical protein